MLFLNFQEHFLLLWSDCFFIVLLCSGYNCSENDTQSFLKLALSSEGFLFSIQSIDLLAFIGPCFSLFACFSLAITHILGPVTHIFKIARCCSEFYAHQPVWLCSPLYNPPAWSSLVKQLQRKSLPIWKMTDDGLFSFAIIWPFLKMFVDSFYFFFCQLITGQ